MFSLFFAYFSISFYTATLWSEVFQKREAIFIFSFFEILDTFLKYSKQE